MDPQRSSSSSPEQFLKFLELPKEIQILIWKLTVPNPRSLHGAIEFILNLNLDRPYAILPSIHDLKLAFHNHYATERYQRNGKDEQYTALRKGLALSMPIWRAILSLLHTCHVSRGITLQTYRLDLESSIEADSTPLWTSDDIVYFTWQYTSNMATIEAFIKWFFQSREKPRPSLISLQHAAFLFRREFARPLNLEPHIEIQGFNYANNFPSLQSFTLFLDPGLVGTVGYRHSGRILLYEPEEVPVEDFYKMTPSQVVQRLAEKFRYPGMKEEDMPLVETFVVQVRKSKRRKRLQAFA
jgi:hypothetical protein